jgi:hypothetical protein
MFFTNPKTVSNLKQTRTSTGQVRHHPQTPGTNKLDLDIVATKIVNNAQLHTSNYWPLLACLVKEQEEHTHKYHTKGEMAMLAIADGQPTNKVAANWAQKLELEQHPEQPRRKTNKTLTSQAKIKENIHVPRWMHWKGN